MTSAIRFSYPHCKHSTMATVMLLFIVLVAPIQQCLAVDSCVKYNIDCGAHGVCSGGECFCTDGYIGSMCTTYSAACAAANCGYHGVCSVSQDGQSATCDCMTTAWHGADCSIYGPTSGIQCTTKWYGASDSTCSSQIGSNQVFPEDDCVALAQTSSAFATMQYQPGGSLNIVLHDGVCTVYNNWGTAFFTYTSDARCMSVTSSSGTLYGYAGVSCVDLCVGVTCGSYGTCGVGGRCVCNSGYTGSTCTTPPPPPPPPSSSTGSGDVYNPSNWLGQYTLKNGCDQTHCCCAQTMVIGLYNATHYIVQRLDMVGQCTSNIMSANSGVLTRKPVSDTWSYFVYNQFHTLTREQNGLFIQDQNVNAPVCSATMASASVLKSNALFRAVPDVLRMLAVTALLFAFTI